MRPSPLPLAACLLLTPLSAMVSRADTLAWQAAVEGGATPYASLHTTPVHGAYPLLFDVGELGGPATYEFLVNAGTFGTSSVLLGGGPQALKYEQHNDLGVIGMTVYGVADFASPVATPLYVNTHVVYTSDGTDSRLFVNGVAVADFPGAPITLTGADRSLAGAQSGETFIDRLDGSILGFASYPSVLSDAEIAARSAAFLQDLPAPPNLAGWRSAVAATAPAPVATHFEIVSGLSPVVVDVGEIAGPRTFEFVVNAGDAPISSGLLGRAGAQGLKFEQATNTASLGVTDFGVADYNSGAPAPMNQVSHIAFVYDGTDTNIYVNGEMAGPLPGVPLDLQRELGLGGIANITPAFSYRDPLRGSVLRFASYDSALSADEVAAHSGAVLEDGGAETFTAWQAATATGAPTASTLFTPVSGSDPTVKDVGPLTGDRSFEFIVMAEPVGTTSALMGGNNDTGGEALKFAQHNNTGMLGLTKFGIADHVSEAPTPFFATCHIVYVYDGVDTLLYVDGTLAHTFAGVALDSAGEQGIAAVAQAYTNIPAPTFFDFLPGHVFGFAAYNTALSAERLAAHAAALTAPPVTAGAFAITDISRNAQTGAVTLTWSSESGKTYRIRQSETLGGFTAAVSGVPATGESTTHTFTPANPAGGRLFFLVEVQE